MILVEQLTPVARLLRDAAVSQEPASFKAFHALFETDTTDRDRYDTLDAASLALCTTHTTIYGAVLAKSKTGCPGD